MSLFGFLIFCVLFVLASFFWFVFLGVLVLVFLGRFKGQVRWPKGPPHFALNPPSLILFCLFLLFFCFLFVFFLFLFLFFCFSFVFFDLKQDHKNNGCVGTGRKNNKWMLGSRHLKRMRGFTRFASNITIASALSNRFPCFRVLFAQNHKNSLILYNTQFFVISPHGAAFRKINRASHRRFAPASSVSATLTLTLKSSVALKSGAGKVLKTRATVSPVAFAAPRTPGE